MNWIHSTQQPLLQPQQQQVQQGNISNSSSPSRLSNSSPIQYLTPKQSPIKLNNPLSGIGFYTPPTEQQSQQHESESEIDELDLTNKAKIQYEFFESKDDFIRNMASTPTTSQSLILSNDNEGLGGETVNYQLEELD